MANITSKWAEVDWWSDATSDANVKAYWRVIARCEESNSDNYSNVYFYVQKSITNTAGGWANYPATKSIKITGTGAANDTHSATATWNFGYCDSSEWVDASGSYSDFYWSKVRHNNDGTLTVQAHITGDRITAGFPIDTYITLTFPTIPRGSTITSFSNFTVENGFTFSYKDMLDGRALTLGCAIGNTNVLSKTYTSSAGSHSDTITFTKAQLNTIYSAIGSKANSANFTLTLSTGSISGSSSATARGSLAAASNKPTVSSPTMAEANSTMKTCGVADTEIVRYLSQKRITVTVSARNGASISSVKVKNGDNGTNVTMSLVSGNTYSAIVNNPSVAKYIVTATDSRGFSTSANATGTLKQYTYPSITKVAFDRDSAVVSTGFIQPTGSYWGGTAGNTTNSVTWNYRINSGAVSANYTPAQAGGTWSGGVTLPDETLLRDHTYYCDVTVKDSFGQTATYRASIGIAELSVWIGKRTVKAEGFVGEHFIGGEADCDKYLNVFPVGAIYMSVTDVNPSTYFGGTWVQVAQGRALIGAGSLQANTVNTWGDVTVGGFNPAVNERGGTYTHRHFMDGQDADGPRAAVGATDSDVNSIGYVSSPPSAWGPSSTKQYSLSATMKDKTVDHSFNHYTPVFGYTRGSTLVEPYLAVYIWQRTA